MTLKELPIGKSASILSVGGEGALRQHFLDMGLIPGSNVTMVKYAPMGDPVEVRIHSYELTLRLADAEKIEITEVQDADEIHKTTQSSGQTCPTPDAPDRTDSAFCGQPAGLLPAVYAVRRCNCFHPA